MRKFHFEIIFPGDITIFFSAALFFAQQKEIWFEHFFLKWGYKYERDTADGNDKMDFGEEVGTIQSHFTQEKTLQPAYGWRRWPSSGACAPAPPYGASSDTLKPRLTPWGRSKPYNRSKSNTNENHMTSRAVGRIKTLKPACGCKNYNSSVGCADTFPEGQGYPPLNLTSFENIPYNSLRSRQSTLSARPF